MTTAFSVLALPSSPTAAGAPAPALRSVAGFAPPQPVLPVKPPRPPAAPRKPAAPGRSRLLAGGSARGAVRPLPAAVGLLALCGVASAAKAGAAGAPAAPVTAGAPAASDGRPVVRAAAERSSAAAELSLALRALARQDLAGAGAALRSAEDALLRAEDDSAAALSGQADAAVLARVTDLVAEAGAAARRGDGTAAVRAAGMAADDLGMAPD